MSEGVQKKRKKNPGENSQDYLVRVSLNDVRISPRKARLTLNMIKGMQVEPALQVLKYSPRKSAVLIRNLLESAVANASEHKSADVDRLWVTGGWVNSGPTLRRYRPRAQGRATPIRKRSSHITVLLNEI